MATVDSLQMHVIDELVDLRDPEQQLTKALPTTCAVGHRTALAGGFSEALERDQGPTS